MNRYAIEGRYPGEWEPITREDAKAAVKVPEAIAAADAALLRDRIPAAVFIRQGLL